MKLRKKHRLFLLAPLFAIAGYTIEPFIFEHPSPTEANSPVAGELSPESDSSNTPVAGVENTAPGKGAGKDDLNWLDDADLDDASSGADESRDEGDVSGEDPFDTATADGDETDQEEGGATEPQDGDARVEDGEDEPAIAPEDNSVSGKKIKPYRFAEIEFNGIMSPYVWRSPKSLKGTLASSIQGRLKSLEPEDVKDFIKNPESRLLVAQWEMLNRVDMEKFAEFAMEEDFRNQLGPLFNNLPWITGLLYDGETKNLEITLDMIRHFREEDPNMDLVSMSEERGEMLRDQFIKRRIAAAVAAEFTNNEWYGTEYWDQREDDHTDMMGLTPLELKKKQKKEDYKSTSRGKKKEERRLENLDEYAYGLERYKFFADGVDQRLFNPEFYIMPNWLMRFPCGWSATRKYGTIESMVWMRENNSLPVAEYANIFSQVPYIQFNDFGYNVDNEHYYQAKVSLYPYNHIKQIRDDGGVCVGQAHYAVGSASANGIPAFIVNEPNHNSYAIFYDGAWHPCNSASISRSPQWNFWDDSSWNTLEIFTELYQDGQNTRDAQLVASIADLLCLERNELTGIKVYEIALSIQPLLRPLWDKYLEVVLEQLAKNPSKWLEVNALICKLMGARNPSACSTYLQGKIYPKMMPVLQSPRHKLEAFEQYFTSLDQQEKNPWEIEKLLEYHYNQLKISPALLLEYYGFIAEAVSRRPEFGSALTWAIRKAYDKNRNEGAKLMALVDEYRESCENKQMFDSAIVRAAEQINAKRFEDKQELFAKYSADYLEGLDPMPKFPRPKGNLVSAGAMIKLSSYCQEKEDMDAYHAGALTEKGGCINSRAWKQESLTIELEELTKIGGIIIVPNGGSAAPYYMWNIQISQDGKTWQQLVELPDNSTKPYVRIQINSQHPSAKYIKIDSGMSMTQGIQFKAVLIYDNKNR